MEVVSEDLQFLNVKFVLHGNTKPGRITAKPGFPCRGVDLLQLAGNKQSFICWYLCLSTTKCNRPALQHRELVAGSKHQQTIDKISVAELQQFFRVINLVHFKRQFPQGVTVLAKRCRQVNGRTCERCIYRQRKIGALATAWRSLDQQFRMPVTTA